MKQSEEQKLFPIRMASFTQPPEASSKVSDAREVIHPDQRDIESAVNDSHHPCSSKDNDDGKPAKTVPRVPILDVKLWVRWSKMVNWDQWRRGFSGGVERTRVYHVWPGKNVFFFRGRLICGPDPKGFILTTVSIVLSSWIFCVYIEDDIPNGASLIISFSLALTAIVLINLILVSAIDPGIIPRNEEPSIEENCTSDGFKSKRIMVNGIEVKLKYCKICRIYRPPRSCHCAVCDNCVEKFDHHCPWIGQCIGQRNYRFYLAFISSALVLFIYTFAFSCRRFNWKMSETGSGFFRTVRNCPETLALAAFSFVAMWFLGGLTCFHMYLILRNQTAYENFRRRFVKSPNPYDKGILRNIQEACFVRLPPSKVNFRAETTPNWRPVL